MEAMEQKEPEVEIYTSERVAGLLLANAVDEQDLAAAMNEVEKLGVRASKPIEV